MGRLPASVIVALFMLAHCPFQEAASSYTHYRLPASIQPDHYHLKIVTHLDNSKNFTFDGEVSISFQALVDTNNITLHVHTLIVDATRIQLKSYQDANVRVCLVGIDTVPEQDYYIIRLCQTLYKGHMYRVKLFFSGSLRGKTSGYYLNSYLDASTKEPRWLAVTDFEAHDARSAFPCLDEPNYKAKFIIWLGHHKSLTALSNMPLEKQISFYGLNDFVWSIFEESVPMSTYLVAYTVNDFAYKESRVEGTDVAFRTWCRRDYIDQCDYAAEVGPSILKYYEEVFGIPFPLKKIDQIAVPIIKTAMENWGLITYPEEELVFAPNSSSQLTKLAITRLISHELAHQWFGNLVTMKWWTDLWLNEGFATYVESLGVEHLSPEFDVYNEDSLLDSIKIFRSDAELSSHPISRGNFEKCDDSTGCFDEITYNRGSLILRMTHMLMGHVGFFEGVRNYLRKHMYKNAEQDDLWAALTETARKFNRIEWQHDMKTIMDTWTLQSGYPLVNVSRNYETGSIEISQHRFLTNSTKPDEEVLNCWWVPLSYTTFSKMNFNTTKPKVWLECDESGKSVPLKLEYVAYDNEWIIFNIQLSGFYRVMYDTENWRLIGYTLRSGRFTDIHAMNRAQIVDDVLTFAWSGYHGYDIAFSIVEYLHNERAYLPWKAALGRLEDIAKLLQSFPQHQTYFNVYMRYIIEPTYYYVNGLNVADETTMLLFQIAHKKQVVDWACRVDLDDCVQTATKYLQQWKLAKNPDDENKIPVDLRATVYCTAIRHGDKDDWTFLFQRYKASPDLDERTRIFTSLTCSRNTTILRDFVELLSGKEKHVGTYDASVAVDLIIKSEISALIGREYYARLDDVVLNVLSVRIVFIEDLNKLLKLIDWNFDDPAKLVQTINFNLAWIERSLEPLKSYLKSRLSAMGILEDNVIG